MTVTKTVDDLPECLFQKRSNIDSIEYDFVL